MRLLFNDELFDIGEESVSVVGVGVQFNRFGNIQTEDTHDGFCIDCIPAGDQVDIIITFGNSIDELLYIVDCVQTDHNGFHGGNLPNFVL